MEKEKDIIYDEMEEVVTPPSESDAPEVDGVSVTSTEVVAPVSRSKEWMKSKYPDESWEDDASYDDFLVNHLTNREKRLASYEDADMTITEMLERNPKFGLIVSAMKKGMPLEVALRRYVNDIFKEDVSEDEPNWEELKKASDEFLAEKKRTDEEIATRNKNLEQSDIVLKSFVEKNFATEDEQIAFVEYLRNALRNIGMGEISESFLDMVLKAYTHDNDVEDAKEAGAIEARNEKITAKRIKEKTDTDGMPIGGGSSPIIEEETVEDDSAIGSILREYEKRRK